MNKQKKILCLIWGAIGLVLMVNPIVTAGRDIPFLGAEDLMNGQTESMLIDDFSGSNGISSFGSQWRMFTDQVMGGRSNADWNYDTIDGRKCVRLWGDVSLANNGGFVQIALPLNKDGRPFDASAFKGVRIWTRGNGEAYHIHLRSSDSRRPWQYYGAKFVANETWQMIDLPFSDFKPENLRSKLKTDRLVRIAVVAIKKEFKADVAVARLEFYR
jgi:hypothetical protein